jgi:hypothetical protein
LIFIQSLLTRTGLIEVPESLTDDILNALKHDPLTVVAAKALIESSIKLGYTLMLHRGGILEIQTPTKTETIRLPYDVNCSFTDEDWKKIHTRSGVYKIRTYVKLNFLILFI